MLAVISACVSAPVQEMSDARQAIRSAVEAGARDHAPNRLEYARQLLDHAETSLQSGSYFDARRYALDARDEAIRAREQSSVHTDQ